MANKYSSIPDLFSAIATSIRNKTNTTSSIIADDFPVVINNIITLNSGTDDATAESYEIANGKTAYAKGEKITGTGILGTVDWKNKTVPVSNEGDAWLETSSTGLTLSMDPGTDVLPVISENTTFTMANSMIANKIGLTASKIIKGKTILGIAGTADTGTDTSDATATAAKIASGYTAYVKGELIEGTAELDPFAPYCDISSIFTPNGDLNLYGGEYKQVFCEVESLEIFSDLLQSDDYKDGGAWFFDITSGFFIQHQGTFGGRALFGIYNTSDTTRNFTDIDLLSLSTNGPMQPTKYPNAIMDLFTDENTACFSNAEVVQSGIVVYLADNLLSSGSNSITILFVGSTSLTVTIPREVHQVIYDNGLSIYLVIPDVVKAAMKNYDSFLRNINYYSNDVRFYGKSMIGIRITTPLSTDITFEIDIDDEDTTAMDASRWYILLTRNSLI